MKKFILYMLLVFAVFSATAQAAPEDGKVPLNAKKQEKIKALYIAYISQQLVLTPAEAEKFWPVHTQYEAELQTVNKSNLPELDRQQAVLNVKKKYQGNFNKILGNERCNSFYKQDAEFRKKLVDRLKQMRQQRQDNNVGRFQRNRIGQQ